MIQDDDGSLKSYDVLDLYDLALLLNYERYTREPRFRRSMLIDVARGGDDFQIFNITLPSWHDPKLRAKRTGFMFKIEDNVPYDDDEPDLPTDMAPLTYVPPRIAALTLHERETIFYQARAHDACFASIALLQYLFEFYDEAQPLRVRTDAGVEYTTHLGAHHTATFTLHEPRTMALSIVCVGEPEFNADGSIKALRHTSYVAGDEPSMKHCAMVFLPPDKGSDLARYTRGAAPVVLDLASMQFGDAGRGLRGGTALFVLEPMARFKARMLGLAERVDAPVPGGPMLERPELQWLRDVARRAKERYDRRETEHWCGHCGAPAERFICRCHTAWYCDAAHQNAAWPFHKNYCSSRTPASAK